MGMCAEKEENGDTVSGQDFTDSKRGPVNIYWKSKHPCEARLRLKWVHHKAQQCAISTNNLNWQSTKEEALKREMVQKKEKKRGGLDSLNEHVCSGVCVCAEKSVDTFQ